MSLFGHLNPYQLHQKLINEYILKRPGDTKLLQRDTSKDRNDFDVLRENHRFLWEEDETVVDSWEKRFAKRYYDKLFKEYCIADLSRYKENMIALRWRIEKEVISGKGQFICGNKVCGDKVDLRSWEVNFAYVEHGQKKNALIKLRLCPECSAKLNYFSKKREVKRIKKEAKKSHKEKRNKLKRSPSPGTSSQNDSEARSQNEVDDQIEEGSASDDELTINAELGDPKDVSKLEEKCWKKAPTIEEKSREEEFDEYLADLLL